MRRRPTEVQEQVPAAVWPRTVRHNIRIVTSRPLIFFLVTLTILLGALLADHFYPKSYASVARLVTDPQSETVKVPPFESVGGPLVNQLEFMQTQVEIVHSPTVLRRVAEAEGLSDQISNLSTPYDAMSQLVDQLAVRLGLRRVVDAKEERLGRATELLLAHTKASTVRDSYVLQMKVSTRDPELSQRVARRLVSSYLTASNDAKLRQLQASESVLSEQLALALKRVETAVSNLSAFDAANGSTQSLTTSTTTGAQSNTHTSTSTTTENPKRVERQQIDWLLSEERVRFQNMQTQLDTTRVEAAAIRGQVSLADMLDAPQPADKPEGLNIKFRLLLYLLLAPLFGLAACYLHYHLAVYRHSTATPVVVKES